MDIRKSKPKHGTIIKTSIFKKCNIWILMRYVYGLVIKTLETCSIINMCMAATQGDKNYDLVNETESVRRTYKITPWVCRHNKRRTGWHTIYKCNMIL